MNACRQTSIFARASEASYPAIRPNQSDSQDSDHTSRSHFAEALYSGIWASTAIPTLGET